MSKTENEAVETTAPKSKREYEPIAVLLAKVMSAVEPVGKNERNTAQNFNFRGIDAVVNAVAPALQLYKVIVVPNVLEKTYGTVEVGQKRTVMTHVTLTVAYTFYGPAGDSITATVVSEAMDSGDKATAKAMSVAFRIALLQALSLPTDEPDPDQYSYERSASVPVAPTTLSEAQTQRLIDEVTNATMVETLRVVYNAWKDFHKAIVDDGSGLTVEEYLLRAAAELGDKNKAGV